MTDLAVGDEVLVTSHDAKGDLAIRSSRLLAMDIYQHHDRHSPISYRKIYTTANTSALQITRSHSLLVRKKHQFHFQYRFASEAEVGDSLYMVIVNNHLIEEVAVTGIEEVHLFDAYAPLTFEGNLVVNHLVVSCYGTFTHSTGHLVKMARRWWLRSHLSLASFFQSSIQPWISRLTCYMSIVVL